MAEGRVPHLTGRGADSAWATGAFWASLLPEGVTREQRLCFAVSLARRIHVRLSSQRTYVMAPSKDMRCHILGITADEQGIPYASLPTERYVTYTTPGVRVTVRRFDNQRGEFATLYKEEIR